MAQRTNTEHESECARGAAALERGGRTSMPIGRPTKFSAYRARLIQQSLSRGSSIQQAAKRAHVHRNTVYRWIEDGRFGRPLIEMAISKIERRRASLEREQKRVEQQLANLHLLLDDEIRSAS